MSHVLSDPIAAVGQIEAVPDILDVVCRMTGMGFAAVARVDEARWLACASCDGFGLGIAAGTALQTDMTICRDARRTGDCIIIDDVADDPVYRHHPAAAAHGFRSYLSVPIRLQDGTFFGTLCALGRAPVRLRDSGALDMCVLFADLIGQHLGALVRAEEDARQARERERLIRELQEARAAAEQSSRAKDQFLAMLGHELRNPLSPIRTALHVMSLKGLVTRETAVIDRQVSHLVRLVDDLMDVSRIARGKIALHPRPIAMASVITRAHELVAQAFADRRQRVETRMPAHPVMVIGDPDRLTQVLVNLLTNASKYSDPEMPIVVSCSTEGCDVRLSVADSGIGIAPEMLSSIFDSFVQQPQALDRSSGGLGLGLTIVKNLVALHGGSVTAHSAGPGRGSEFVVRLPAALLTAANSLEIDASGPPVRATGSRRRVLVVDDNEDGAEMLGDLLRLLDYDVQIAHDGAAALEVVRSFSPEIAVLDIGLPVMNGYELAVRLSEVGQHPRLIALTGYGQPIDRVRTRTAGFAAHLVKPVTVEALTTALDAESPA